MGLFFSLSSFAVIRSPGLLLLLARTVALRKLSYECFSRPDIKLSGIILSAFGETNARREEKDIRVSRDLRVGEHRFYQDISTTHDFAEECSTRKRRFTESLNNTRSMK